MNPIPLSEQDLTQLKKQGITREQLEDQIRRFVVGFPYLSIVKAANRESGITAISSTELEELLKCWEETLHDPSIEVVKFVPASGAASRMFKALFTYLNGGERSSAVAEFFEHIQEFAFFEALNRSCMLGEGGKGCERLLQMGEERLILEYLLLEKGLNYGHLPKALLLFHRYKNGIIHTATEEQMIEGARYARNSDGTVRLHFTLSPEHVEPFEALVAKKKAEVEERFSVELDITHSLQKPETDTIAVDMENNPMRNEDGSLMFRPGGHGALIYNLNDIKADIVFIKNIDNVVPEPLSSSTIIYKKMIGGYLIQLRTKVFGYIHQLLNEKKPNTNLLTEVWNFLKKTFEIEVPGHDTLSLELQQEHLLRLLNRPIRVCGMVRNEGEPGGGPYIVRAQDGSTSLQILESSQINMEDASCVAKLNAGEYFNPVDLVCSIRDYKGEPFNLLNFVDKDTGFISQKSQAGKELKALELPGLWNGAMSNWNSAFVEVPADTFNPVKVVNDLLRPTHKL